MQPQRISSWGDRLPWERVRWTILVIGIIIGCAGLLLVRGAWSDSMTIDEEFSFHSGACLVHTGLIDLDPTNPAGTKLLASVGVALSGVPTDQTCPSGSYVDWTYHTLFPQQPTLSQLRWMTFITRLLPILCTLALITLCAWWAFRLGGPLAAILAAAFIGFDPTVQAMGHLVSVDMTLTYGYVSCLAALWQWRRRQQRRWLVFAGLALGVAFLGKASAVLLLPLLVLLIFATASGALLPRLRQTVLPSLAVIAIGYLELTLVYVPFRHSAPNVTWLPQSFAWFTPESWLWGMQYQLVDHVGSAGLFYLNGQAGYGGSWLFFPEALVLKSTIGGLIALLIGVTWLAIRRQFLPLLWIVLPGAVYFAAAMYSGINIGIRYITPSIVLFSLAASIGIAQLPRWRVGVGAVLGVIGIAATVLGPVGSIGYFNALAIGRHSYYLADSNIDWGQDGYRLHDWWVQAGQPPVQVDLFGGLPASYFIPNAYDLGSHPERGDYSNPTQLANTQTLVSVNMGTIFPDWPDSVAHPTCTIGTSIVVIGRSC